MREDMSLTELQAYFGKVLYERGFGDQSVEEKMMLLVEEVGELAKAIRKQQGGKIDYDRIQNYDTVQGEIADITIVLFSLCNILDIDLFEEVKQKEIINMNREWK